MLAASFGGRAGIAPAYVMSLREFAAAWEYLIPSAIFTAPAHSEWSGAALVSRDGKLVGVGSLVVGDVTGRGKNLPGNMYVPIDLLPPIMADLNFLRAGPAGPGRPWLGLNAEEIRGLYLRLAGVTDDGPAQQAGIHANDIILAINGETPRSLADFYRKVWSLGCSRRIGAARPPAEQRRETHRRQVDQPPRSPAAEIHLLISGKLL